MKQTCCKQCKKNYDRNESIRIYGEFPSDNGCCSPNCYTVWIIKKQNEKEEERITAEKIQKENQKQADEKEFKELLDSVPLEFQSVLS